MATSAILRNRKNRHISAAVGAISPKCGIVMQFHLLTVLTVEILKIQAEIWYVN